MLQSLYKFVKKKSIKATDVPNFEILEVLGVSNKLGITKTDHNIVSTISKKNNEKKVAHVPINLKRRYEMPHIWLLPLGVASIYLGYDYSELAKDVKKIKFRFLG